MFYVECSNYARLIFATLDQNSDGTVNFEDFLVGLSILLRGTIDEKLRWIFSLYDINKDGKVTRDELQLVITSIYELLGKFTKPPIDDNEPLQHAEIVFKVIFKIRKF